jgi:hypothetical protein
VTLLEKLYLVERVSAGLFVVAVMLIVAGLAGMFGPPLLAHLRSRRRAGKQAPSAGRSAEYEVGLAKVGDR